MAFCKLEMECDLQFSSMKNLNEIYFNRKISDNELFSELCTWSALHVVIETIA